MWALPAIGLSPSPSNMMNIIFTFGTDPKEALMTIDSAIALVTGADRSIGVAFTRGMLRTTSARAVPEARRDFSGIVINVGENQQYSKSPVPLFHSP
jgi:hypothetical protein